MIDLIGNTPLLRLKGENVRKDIRIYGKAEFLNISGSVKDRAATAMIAAGIRSGALRKGMTIIDATSGNTGIAFARIGAASGYEVALCIPENASQERIKLMRAYGARIILTSAVEGNEGAYAEAQRIVSEQPDRYFYPNQYVNPENWKAHYYGTAAEIISQTSGEITHFVSGVGTGGTFMGCAKRFKEFGKHIKTIAVTPDSPFHGIEGIKHYSGITAEGFYDAAYEDERIEVTTEQAYAQTKRLAQSEGLLVGVSSGANVAAALKIAEDVPAGSVIVTVLCDAGDRYLSGNIYGGEKEK